MRNKAVGSTILSIGLLALACGLLAAQGVKLSPQMAISKGAAVVHRATTPPPSAQVLYSNLGSKTDAYDDTGGWLIEGPNNPISGQSQVIANPFTLSANSTVTGIQIALGYLGAGTNNAAVAVFSDNGGLPGRALGFVNVQNLPTFGTCCDLVTIKDPKGFKAKGGTQYWLVAGTDGPSKTAYDAWAYTWNDSQGPIAFEGTATNNVWTAFTGNVNAYAIYGTTP
ncbi:MAG: choice-of-anchor R domain-containing protein [Terriglobales bacterium]